MVLPRILCLRIDRRLQRPPVLYGLGSVFADYAVGLREIGNRARHFQHAMVGAG